MVQSIPSPSSPLSSVAPSVTHAGEIFYPDCDGQPVANNTEQFEIIVLIKGNLDILFADDPNVLIAGDLFWYPIEGNNTVKYAPDVMVALGRPKGHRYSYKQWQEGHQPPQVVFEILSPSNTDLEMARKLLFYDRHGVEEYYIYNPMTHVWQVWLRGQLGLDCVDLDREWVSPRLGFRVDLTQPVLALYRPDGQAFLSFLELEARAEQARQRADEEKLRADEEKLRADEEKLRADEEKLRADEEKLRADEEKLRANEEKLRADEEKLRADAQQQRADEERQRADEERQRADRLAERLRALGEDPNV